jgi:hypothetical protein
MNVFPAVTPRELRNFAGAVGICPMSMSDRALISKRAVRAFKCARFADLSIPPPRGKTCHPSGSGSAAKMAYARRPTRLRFVRSHDHGAANPGAPRRRRHVFPSLPDGELPFGSERLVLSRERLFRLEDRRLAEQRSEHVGVSGSTARRRVLRSLNQELPFPAQPPDLALGRFWCRLH